MTTFLEELWTIDTICDEGGRWAVLHGGIDVDLGVAGTSRWEKLTIKAVINSVAWYDEYDGSDGLIVCGHQHQDVPSIRRRDGRLSVINVDTGCCYGNMLTAYIIEDDRFVSVDADRVYCQERP